MINADYLHVWGRIEHLQLMSGDGEDTPFILKPSSSAHALFRVGDPGVSDESGPKF